MSSRSPSSCAECRSPVPATIDTVSLGCGCYAHLCCWRQRVVMSKDVLLQSVRCGRCYGTLALNATAKRCVDDCEELVVAMKRTRV